MNLPAIFIAVFLAATPLAEDWYARPLTSADLEGRTADELRILRNEIYARHGYVFKSEELAARFKKESWYHETPAFDPASLTGVEKANVALLKKTETDRRGSSVSASSVPAPKADIDQARRLLERWILVQNTLVWKQYAALYAPEFQGIRRSGTRTVTLDRKHWLAERSRMFAQGGIAVEAEKPTVEGDGLGGIRVSFQQAWAAGSYADHGNKTLLLRRDPNGELRIVREEMMGSQIDSTPIVAKKLEDAALLKLIYPNNANQSKEVDSSWTFTKAFDRTWPDTTFGALRVVLWNESANPFRHTQFDSEYFGGIAVIHDGRLLGAHFGIEGAPEGVSLIKAVDSVVLAVTESCAMRGEFTEALELFILKKDGLRLKDRVPVRMNNEAGENSYSCAAKVEIRDVDGNGVLDVVVTPIELRRSKSCYGFPRSERRWLF